MTAASIINPIQQFFDIDGSPLDGGKLYFGAIEQNPETTQITVYWDAAATQPAAQPISTMNGYPVRSGSPAIVYALTDYSLLVRTKTGRQVFYLPNSAALGNASGGALAVQLATKRERITAAPGQTVFTLTTMAYPNGTRALWVIVDGLVITDGYTETSSSVVTFAAPFAGGEELDFAVGELTSSGSTKFSGWDTLGAATEPGGAASFYFRRDANYTGGSPGYVNAGLRVDTWVTNPAATSFEWGLVSVLHNYAAAGENVAAYAQGNKYLGAGGTWGAVVEVIEKTATDNPTTGTVGLEVDVNCNGTDSYALGNRVGIDLVLRKTSGIASPPARVSWGFRIQGDADTVLDRGYSFYPGMTVNKGFDTSTATILTAAYQMAQNQSISFNAAGTRQLLHNGGGWVFKNNTGTTYWSMNDDYSLVSNGVQLLGTRRVGWGTPTGTVAKTTFDTASVTLPQLAQRVAALINDLTTHGLIGA